MKYYLYNELLKIYNTEMTPFYFPGHKHGSVYPEEFSKNVFKIDFTELEKTDNLQNPDGIIKKAQLKAAKIFGAQNSFFLVNGSSGGILAMINAVCKDGDKLIIARNFHSAVINGVILSGVNPVYVYPEYIEKLNMWGGVNPEAVKQALEENPDARGVLITSPDYFGVCSDIKEIARITHEKGKILMVDEAHGAHFSFSGKLPVSAMEAGADICVQSAHKTLPVPTQASILHLGNIELPRLRQSINMFQTTSPSYILMSFLDAGIEIMSQNTKRLEKLSTLCKDMKKRINKNLNKKNTAFCLDKSIINNNIIDKNFVNKNGVADIDPLRISINLEGLDITGYELGDRLRKEFNIQPEMTVENMAVFVITIATKKKHIEYLEKCLNKVLCNVKHKIDKSINKSMDKSIDKSTQDHIPSTKSIVIPRAAYNGEHEKIKLSDGVGRICAQTVVTYQPGIPLLCPGEVITKEIVEYAACKRMDDIVAVCIM